MKIMRIMIFVFLFNLVLGVIYGMHPFAWGKGAAAPIAMFDWRYYAGIMIGTALLTGIFGMLTQTTASGLLTIFTSSCGAGLTAATINWLALPVEISVIIGGMVGLLALYAIIQVLTGSAPD